jgi:hypothetical protein
MNKKQLIDLINRRFEGNLHSNNTCFSSINKSKRVWWANIHVSKFVDEVHLLLADADGFLWITLPRGFVSNLSDKFKIRADKNVVDLEISADRNFKYLIDVKSGGTGFDFRGFVKERIAY